MRGGKKGEGKGREKERGEGRGEERRGGLSHYIILSIYFSPGWKTHPASGSCSCSTQGWVAPRSAEGTPGQAPHSEQLRSPPPSCHLYPRKGAPCIATLEVFRSSLQRY